MTATGQSRAGGLMISRLALGLLIVAEVLLLAMVVVGGARYPGYDHVLQFISELGATGAPDGWAVSWLAFLPIGVLVMAACLLIAWRMRSSALALLGFLLLAFNAYAYVNSVWFRCEFECAGTSVAQGMHNLIGLLGYLAGCLGLLLAGLSAQGHRILRVFGLICAGLAFIGFMGLAATAETGGMAGAFQRLTEAAIALFMLAYAWVLATERDPVAGRS